MNCKKQSGRERGGERERERADNKNHKQRQVAQLVQNKTA